MPLPGAAPWLGGILPGEGEVWPVLSERFWGGQASAPDVCAVLSHRGRVLVLPGLDPEVLTGAMEGPGDHPLGEWMAGVLRGAKEVACIDVPKLYSALGLGYNETGYE